MKHIFIMNLGSGKARGRESLIAEIREAGKTLGKDVEIYLTKGAGDGASYARKLCGDNREDLRLYACGGDGTLHEVVNGAFGYDNVEIGALPIGTGNDYVRNYGKVSDFLDIRRQLGGCSVWSDAIHYRARMADEVTEGYCVNMFNIGFDCNVVDMTSRVKRWPLMHGSMAYIIAVLLILVQKRGANLRIEYEDGRVIDEKLLLAAIANGCYCGGGVKGVPLSELDDALMDVSVVRDISRRLFIALFPSYAKGTQLDNPAITKRNVIRYSQEKSLRITANGESMKLCTDGEITTQQEISFSIAERAFRFIVPEGL